MNRAAFTRAACLTAAGALLLAAPAGAQQNPASKPVDPEAASIPLRTALYHDPTLAPPLDRLLQLYRDAGRAKELVDSYRQHVAQYPADAGALIVLIRLLSATNDAEAGRLTRAAATRFPEHPFLQFLLFTELQKTHESGALDALDRAIARETLPTRKRAWIDQLVPLAISSNRPELAQQHLEKLAAESTNAEGKLETARKMIAHKLYAPALTALTAAAAQKPSAEIGVDLDLAAAGAELGLGRNAAAASRLDALLARLAADYWRRNEILHRRTALVKSDADREAMLGAARSRLKAAPNDAAAALELAQLLAAFEFRREALDVLQATLARIPASEKIEKAVLELFDLLRDERGREAFLEQRLRAAPERQDLALARARSLLLLGRRSEALTVFDAFAAKLEAPARLIQILELARFLRRSAMPADAAAFFERAVALAPERLEVRRELAETWLAAGQKQKAREVFSKPLPEETETENLLEVVQFFLKQEMFEEARAALAQRRAKDPQNFDLRLADITVATRLAEREQGEKLILETRTLADTEARYRRWLESAVAFHDAFDLTAEFFRTEQERVLAAGGGWIGEAAPRRLIFAEVAANHGQKSGVASMLQGALEEDLPAELRIELRRRQLALIENDAAQAAAAERQLTALEKEDSARADEYRIRLALLAMRSQRMDRVQQILGPNAESIDVSKISDATLLSGLENLLRQQGGGTALIRILEQLTVVQPANTGVWERWISTLAISGDEERLRVSLRRLREGVDRLPLTEETRAILREQLLGSYWRSLAKLIQEDADDSQLSTALPMIELAGRLAEKREESLWLTWTRGYVLNRLGRREARDEALRELERLAMLPVSSAPAGTEPDSPVPPETPGMIAFPDGLVIGIGPARELLTGSAPLREMPPAVPISGPRGTLKARWALETDGRAPVSRIVPIDSKRLLIGDDNGKLYALDSLSGK
ncbi:MAG TPA: tetratricopeptide repeat protein, partial [Chthoniobacteraceae bacterium]